MCKQENISWNYFFSQNLAQDSKRKSSEANIYKCQPLLQIDNTNDISFTDIYGPRVTWW